MGLNVVYQHSYWAFKHIKKATSPTDLILTKHIYWKAFQVMTSEAANIYTYIHTLSNLKYDMYVALFTYFSTT